MDAPKCKICGHLHYGLCAGSRRLAGAKLIHTMLPRAKMKLLPGPDPIAVIALPDAEPCVVRPGGSTETLKPKFDRTTYQREYMRKRRAKPE